MEQNRTSNKFTQSSVIIGNEVTFSLGTIQSPISRYYTTSNPQVLEALKTGNLLAAYACALSEIGQNQLNDGLSNISTIGLKGQPGTSYNLGSIGNWVRENNENPMSNSQALAGTQNPYATTLPGLKAFPIAFRAACAAPISSNPRLSRSHLLENHAVNPDYLRPMTPRFLPEDKPDMIAEGMIVAR